MKDKMFLITDQKELENFPKNAVPMFLAEMLIDGKVKDSILCRDKNEAERMCNEFNRDYELRKCWNRSENPLDN